MKTQLQEAFTVFTITHISGQCTNIPNQTLMFYWARTMHLSQNRQARNTLAARLSIYTGAAPSTH